MNLTMPEAPSHGSSPTRRAPQARRMRTTLSALAVAAALVVGWTQPVAAQTSSEPDPGIPNPSTCVSLTDLTAFTTTGGPFEGGTKITWSVTAPPICSDVVVFLKGIPVPRSGSMVVDPTVTTQYGLMARMGTAAKGLASTVVLGGDIYRYAMFRNTLITNKNPNVPVANAARLIAADITGALSTQAKLKLVGRSLEIHIIPSSVTLTQLPHWKGAKGKMTCEVKLPDGKPNTACVDPRPWDKVRGVGGHLIAGTNRIAMAAGEETLVKISGKTKFPNTTATLGHTLAHELGHTVLDFAAPNEKANVEKVLKANEASHDYMGYDAYTKSTPHEYFAEGTAGLFDYEWGSAYANEYTPKWLWTNEPKLTAILSRVYPGR